MSVTLSKTSKNAPLLIYNSYSCIQLIEKVKQKFFEKCEYSRKYACHGRLHTKLNYEFIKTVDEHENHTGNPRCEATRKYYERLRQESEQNQANLYFASKSLFSNFTNSIINFKTTQNHIVVFAHILK
jgi:hypothetical protein